MWILKLFRFLLYSLIYTFSNERGDFGGEDEPTAPSLKTPENILGKSALLQEIYKYIQGGAGQQLGVPAEVAKAVQAITGLMDYQPQLTTLPEPTEYGVSSKALEGMLGYQPEQFQFPMEKIQQALSAQQGLQLQDYQKQIRPILANQGQLDSTYYANLLGDYLQGQQAQTYGTTADLYTQQAQQNYDLSKWLPQYQAGVSEALANIGGLRGNVAQYNVGQQNALQQWQPQFQSAMAGQLAGLGGQKAGIEQYNMQYPYSTFIPALGSLYGTASGQAGEQYQAAMVPYQQDLANYQQSQAQQQQLWSQLGGLALNAGLAAATGGASLPFSGLIQGGVGGQTFDTSQFGQTWSPYASSGGSSVFNPQWGR